MNVLVDIDYKPSDDEPFMNERQAAYFRQKLTYSLTRANSAWTSRASPKTSTATTSRSKSPPTKPKARV